MLDIAFASPRAAGAPHAPDTASGADTLCASDGGRRRVPARGRAREGGRGGGTGRGKGKEGEGGLARDDCFRTGERRDGSRCGGSSRLPGVRCGRAWLSERAPRSQLHTLLYSSANAHLCTHPAVKQLRALCPTRTAAESKACSTSAASPHRPRLTPPHADPVTPTLPSPSPPRRHVPHRGRRRDRLRLALHGQPRRPHLRLRDAPHRLPVGLHPAPIPRLPAARGTSHLHRHRRPPHVLPRPPHRLLCPRHRGLLLARARELPPARAPPAADVPGLGLVARGARAHGRHVRPPAQARLHRARRDGPPRPVGHDVDPLDADRRQRHHCQRRQHRAVAQHGRRDRAAEPHQCDAQRGPGCLPRPQHSPRRLPRPVSPARPAARRRAPARLDARAPRPGRPRAGRRRGRLGPAAAGGQGAPDAAHAVRRVAAAHRARHLRAPPDAGRADQLCRPARVRLRRRLLVDLCRVREHARGPARVDGVLPALRRHVYARPVDRDQGA